MKYELITSDDHMIFILDGKKILIDTGSPISMGEGKSLNFGDKEHILKNTHLGINIAELNELANLDVDVLVGVDILRNHSLTIDWVNKEVVFDGRNKEDKAKVKKYSNYMGIPIITLEVNGEKINGFLDTGAKISYLSSDYEIPTNSIGFTEDFYPGIGSFQTELYNHKISFADQEFNITFGRLPNILEMTLLIADVNSIIGSDFFKQAKVTIDLSCDKIYLENYI